MLCLPSCLSKNYKSYFNHSPGENTLQQLSLSAHCSSASPSLSGQREIAVLAALTLYRCWELRHVSEASTEVLAPLMVSLHQTEELEVIWRKGDHGRHGRSAAPSLWKTDLGEMNHLRSKTSRTGLEAVPYLKQVPRPIGCKFVLFLSPSDFSAGAALHYYVFSGLFHLSDSTVQQSCQELDCHHRQHSPCSLDNRNNLLLSQIRHSQSSIF